MLPKKKTVSKQRDRLVRNLNDLYQDEAQGSGMMRRVSRSPFVAPSSSSEATGRKSAPSPVAKSSSSSAAAEEVQQEVQQEDVEVKGGGGAGGGAATGGGGRGGGKAEGLYARPFNTFGATHTTREPPHY
jgi:hypothetical protein